MNHAVAHGHNTTEHCEGQPMEEGREKRGRDSYRRTDKGRWHVKRSKGDATTAKDLAQAPRYD